MDHYAQDLGHVVPTQSTAGELQDFGKPMCEWDLTRRHHAARMVVQETVLLRSAWRVVGR